MSSQVFAAVKMKIVPVLIMMSCNLVGGSSALKMEVICSSDMLVTTYKTKRCHN